MTYLKGNELVFRGMRPRGPRSPFGAVDEDAITQALEKYAASKINTQVALAKAKQAAAGQLQQVIANPMYGPVFGDALKGALNPAGVAARAAALSKNYSGDKLKQEAFRLAYSQGRAALTEINARLSMNPYVKDVMAAVDLGIGGYGDAKKLIDRMQRMGIDGAGVQDALQLGAAAVLATRVLAKSLGASAGVTRAFDETADSMLILAGCAKGLVAGAATGSAAGGLAGCAMGFMQKALRLVSEGKTHKQPEEVVDDQLALFVPTADQMAVIANDAERLARVLRFHYGVKSYASMYWRVRGRDPNGKFPTSAKMLTVGFPLKHSSTNPTGYTMGDILSALRLRSDGWARQQMQQPPPGSSAIRELPETYFGTFWFFDLGENVYRNRVYGSGASRVRYGDYPENVISAGARWARGVGAGLFSATPFALTPVHNRSGGVVKGVGSAAGATAEPFLYLDELLSFFAAVTRYEVDKGATNWQTFLPPNQIPVRLMAVAEMQRDGQHNLYKVPKASKPYSNKCWTMSRTCATDDFCQGFKNRVGSKSPCALRTFAALRLMAAFSYMNLLYKWESRDLISDVQDVRGRPGAQLRIPVNPRSALVGGKWVTPTINQMYNAISARGALFNNAAQAAIAAAAQDQKFFETLDTSATSTFHQAFQTAGGRAGGAFDPLTLEKQISAGKVTLTRTSASSAAPVLLGGAVLAALLLLKR